MSLNVVALKRARSQSPDPATLQDKDVALLVGLADSQLRYGQAEEAFVLLRLCQVLRPLDLEIRLKLARALTALEEYEAAEAVLADVARLAGPEAAFERVAREALAERARKHLGKQGQQRGGEHAPF